MFAIQLPARRAYFTLNRVRPEKKAATGWLVGAVFAGLLFLLPLSHALADSDLPTDAPAISSMTGLQDCNLHSPSNLRRIEARCGWFAVAENRDDPESRRIRLHVALVPAVDEAAEGMPLALLAGGPGQSAQDFYTTIAPALARVRKQHPILVLDQRGTGMSNRLACDQQEEIEGKDWSLELMREAVSECFDQLDSDPRFYTTSVAVRDLDEVREALGFAQLNLLGGSYGTRVALHYLRRYPDHTRAVVIDGVVPADLPLGPGIAIAAQQALDMGLARCAADPACSEAFPDPASDLKKLQGRLATEGIAVRLPDPVNGGITDGNFGKNELMIALRLLHYSSQTVALIPLLLHEAANGNPGPMLAQSMMIAGSINQALAMGMHNAVMCTEDVPFIQNPEGYQAELEKTFMGTQLLDGLLAICDVWPAGVIDDDFKTPVTSDKPVLLLSGEADPVTPPSYADQAIATLSNSRSLVLAGQGHGQVAIGCMPKVLDEFINNPDPVALDASCKETIKPAGFFLDFNGPSP